jgi:hypothetical protein
MGLDHRVVDVEGKQCAEEFQKSRRIVRVKHAIILKTVDIFVNLALGGR